MDYTAASLCFHDLAAARGWPVTNEGQEVAVRSGNACLRLRPCGRGVLLEITHGSDDDPPVGWLNLYSDPPAPDAPGLTECIEYGLDLMQPALGEGSHIDPGEQLPEEVLYEFMIANLGGGENDIRPLILDHLDAALLWQGAYPPEVAELLAQQYEGMGIARVEEGPDRVLLQSSASPIPLAVVRFAGEWRVDASPIIEFRKRVNG